MHRRLFTRAEGESVRPDGLIIVNAPEVPPELSETGRRIAAVDADTIAREYNLARASVPNLSTVMTGALACLCNDVDYDALENAIREAFPRLITPNLRALRAGWKAVRTVEAVSS